MPRDLGIPKDQYGWNLVSMLRVTPREISKYVGPVVACLCSKDHPGHHVDSGWWNREGGWWSCR